MTDHIAAKGASLLRAALCAALIAAPMIPAGCTRPSRGPFPSEQGVTFSVRAPGAKRVAIAGSFNTWDRNRDLLSGPDSNGWWSITLPLGPGRHEYLFLVDGSTWLADPHGTATADDGFGGKNSVLYLQR